jgi:vacuolar-type H+-ATPase catalytic subunit A/Vma1
MVKRFLKSGVLEDGEVTIVEEGTPQGGVMTPPTQQATLSLSEFFLCQDME